MKSENRDRVEVDSHLQDVIVFMQSNVPAEKLVSVAEHLGGIAPLLWGHYSQAGVQAIQVVHEPISAEPHTESSATE